MRFVELVEASRSVRETDARLGKIGHLAPVLKRLSPDEIEIGIRADETPYAFQVTMRWFGRKLDVDRNRKNSRRALRARRSNVAERREPRRHRFPRLVRDKAL